MTTRLHILSDLHLEFAPFTPPSVPADAVILAGDIHTGRNGMKWALETFADRPVIYVLGNHEFYGQKVQKLIAASGVRLWVHGHIHRTSDYMVGETRVVANPRGYPTEPQAGFDAGLVIEV